MKAKELETSPFPLLGFPQEHQAAQTTMRESSTDPYSVHVCPFSLYQSLWALISGFCGLCSHGGLHPSGSYNPSSTNVSFTNFKNKTRLKKKPDKNMKRYYHFKLYNCTLHLALLYILNFILFYLLMVLISFVVNKVDIFSFSLDKNIYGFNFGVVIMGSQSFWCVMFICS